MISTVGFEQPEARRVHSVMPDVVDEHYYRTVDTFLKMARGQYETYDRKGPEIFVGEWAAYETPFEPWNAALAAASRRRRTCARPSATPRS